MASTLGTTGRDPKRRYGWPLATTLVLIFLSATARQAPAQQAAAENWPQWRGPLGNGSSPTADPPTKWSETENVRWKVKVPGSGRSSPIVWDQYVFLQTAIPTGKKPEAAAAPQSDAGRAQVRLVQQQPRRGPGGPGGGRGPSGFGRGGGPPTEAFQFALLCLDRATGKTLWQKVAREEVPHEGLGNRDSTYAPSSPVTDGQHVYAYFGSRGLHCYDLQGNLKWSKDLGRMQTKNSFGEGSSPALHGDTIVINWDHEGPDFIVALDKNTGDERWRTPRDEDTSWATPVVVEHEGQAQVVTAASKKVRSYDLKTGKLLWEIGPLTANSIPSPVAGDGMVFATSGFRGSALFAIRLGGSGDLKGTESVVWTLNRGTPYVPSPLLYDGRLYFFSVNNNILTALDAKTGKPVIDSQRVDDLQGNVYASPVAAGGKVYLVARGGAAVVLKASDKLEVLASNQLDEQFDASPAVAGKQLFLRGQQSLYCIAEK
jgi:outer membrane protein assembly factor BamB